MIGSRGKFWLRIAEIRDPSCTRCPLHKTGGNVCVMGRGSAYAPIVLIGEAPGEAEARTGKPFMGKAGELLNSLLDDNSMSHLIYITNTCKCRPPENRKPTPEERNTCTYRYLRRELEFIKPRVVMLLGKTPIEQWFNGEPFKRGDVYELKGYTVIPTWHPAYPLHSGSKVAVDQLRSHLLKSKEIAANANLLEPR